MIINDYISIKEAVKLSMKSHSTIQRLCNSLEGTKHVVRESGKYLISQSYILKHFVTTEQKENQTVNHAYSMTIQILKNELDAKNQQINDLLERLREANIINMNFQKQLKEKNPETYQADTTKKTFLQSLKSLFIVDE